MSDVNTVATTQRRNVARSSCVKLFGVDQGEAILVQVDETSRYRLQCNSLSNVWLTLKTPK